MSRWSDNGKPVAEPSEEFLRNEERRRQMIIEAARLRREKERRLQQQADIEKKKQEQAVTRIKEEKKELITRYLRQPGNMHDRYEKLKRDKKQMEPVVEVHAKWGAQKGISEGKSRVNTPPKQQQQQQRKQYEQQGTYQPNKKMPEKAKVREIEKQTKKQGCVPLKFDEWGQPIQEQISIKLSQNADDDSMLASQLLDSLDLDGGSMARTKQVSQMLKIAVERQKNKEAALKKKSEEDRKAEQERIRQLIGYESTVFDDNQITFKPTQISTTTTHPTKDKPATIESASNKNSRSKERPSEKNKPPPPLKNETELINQLKNEPQGKLLNWAAPSDASDLFSQCSSAASKRSKKSSQVLSQLNSDIREGKVKLSVVSKTEQGFRKGQKPLSKEKVDTSKPLLRASSPARSNSKERVPSYDIKPEDTPEFKTQQKERPPIPTNPFKKKQPSLIEQRILEQRQNILNRNSGDRSLTKNTNTSAGKETRPNSMKEVINSRGDSGRTVNSNSKRDQSPQTQEYISTKPNLRVRPNTIANKVPIIQHTVYDQSSVATHDTNLDVGSFIKNELMSLNEEEQRLQRELRQIHLSNREQIQAANVKYGIKTDYKHSFELMSEPDRPYSSNSSNGRYTPATEDEIEESLQRIDDMLLRKKMNEEQSSPLCPPPIINPMASPQDLQKQVLQLAANISRQFDPSERAFVPDGYGAKMVKKPFSSGAHGNMNSNYHQQPGEIVDQSIYEEESTVQRNYRLPNRSDASKSSSAAGYSASNSKSQKQIQRQPAYRLPQPSLLSQPSQVSQTSANSKPGNAGTVRPTGNNHLQGSPSNQNYMNQFMGIPKVLQLSGTEIEDSLDYDENFVPLDTTEKHQITVNERLKKMLLDDQ